MLLETDGMNQPMLASKGRPYTLCSPHGKASRFQINIEFYTMLLGHVHIYMGNRVCHLSLYCRGTPKPLAASTSNLACESALVQEHKIKACLPSRSTAAALYPQCSYVEFFYRPKPGRPDQSWQTKLSVGSVLART